MENPRFPHTLKLIVQKTDEHGEPVTDTDGNPIESVCEIAVAVLKDGAPVRDTEGKFITEKCTELPFGYRTSTGNSKTSGDVLVCDYKLACPPFFTPMPAGSILEISDYSRTCRFKVIKQTTYNFGSNIWVDEIRN